MFLGHFGLGMASKKLAPTPSLSTLFFASQFLDLLWPIFLLTGIEDVLVEPGNTAFTPLNFVHYPWSHSLVAVIGWGLLFSLLYYFKEKNKRSAIMLGVLVISHWFLDLLVHAPDLPIGINAETKYGFGLWNHVTVTIIIEMIIFIAGIGLYLQATRPKNKTGIYAFWSLILFFVIIYIMNLLGDPPPDKNTIAVVGLAQWLLILWGYWIDRNRIKKPM